MIRLQIFRRLINLHWAFRLLLAVPAVFMLARYAIDGSMGDILQSSGEWAARMLIATLAITPVRLLLKQQTWFGTWSMWLFKRRRDLGSAAFLYALLHLVVYVVRQSSFSVILFEVQFKEYIAGWLGFATMLILAATSNDRSLRSLGVTWKKIQRLAYAAGLATFLHWIWISRDNTSALLHFLPLAAFEAWRLWYNFSRPSRQHP